MRQNRLISSLIALSAGCAAGVAGAAPALRTQVDQRGDFVMFGNTLGFECDDNAGVPTPTVGSVTCPNGNGAVVTDTAPDVFWRSDDPAAGQATASTTFVAADARSTAVLSIPNGATITYARIYWAGMLTGTMSTDPSVQVLPPAGVNQTINADTQNYVTRGANSWYQSSAEITSAVLAAGSGAYRISGVGSVDLDGLNSNDPLVGWVIVVFYSHPNDPPRNLALFDGLDLVAQGGSTPVTIDGFLVPNNAGFDAKLGVIAYEGEQQYTGDALTFNGTALFNNVNPANNFFNSSRSFLGNAVSNVGDLPQLTGEAASMAGMDVDVVNVKPQLKFGDTSASIVATSAMGGDTYALGAFVTSIATFKPDFTTSGKTFVDVNGGSLMPGDVVEYSVTVSNTGNDASANTLMTDQLPLGVTYVPNSVSVSSGPNAGNKTDAANDDVADYTAGTRTIRVWLGTGAMANLGGSLAVNQTTVIKFRVTIDANAPEKILNQAIITAEGAQGAPSGDYPTDGNGNGNGVPPTEVIVDKCADNDDCDSPTPACDTAPSPNVCVQCVVAADCTNPTAPQCLPNHTCGCTSNCEDTDTDGIPDDTEEQIGTDPLDADSDDDGVMDGAEPDPAGDSDGDTSIDALDPDSDNDGLFDGTEVGNACNGLGTAPGSTHCRADGDAGATITDPLDDDTDDGGARDGSEDLNHDGVKDAGETDPTVTHGDDDDDLLDDDNDGLTNGEEEVIGSNPDDADSDDDGVLDGGEANPSDNSDDDDFINVLDPDSDNDGLLDGTELGFDCDGPGTDMAAGHCKADGDAGATVTSPFDPDTDGGGVTDGNEDSNLDGVKDAGETDPTLGHGADDGSLADDDTDGLSNGLEGSLGTNPNDADSDDDGVLDGLEPNFSDDADLDGDINALDPDSDDDGLFDGTELGKPCTDPPTDATKEQCIADGDAGATTTNPLDADSDDGSVKDGDEDANHNGLLDAGERDPNDPSDDMDEPVGQGGAGGMAGSAGSAGTPGGGSSGASGGDMAVAGNGSGGVNTVGGNASAGNASAGTPGNGLVDGILEGGGCACRTSAPANKQAPLTALISLLVIGAAALRRRRSGR